ncbi:MAG: hypothetical protein ABR949_10660 [Candidatus Aquilonibacter sp.]|jgi:hypothetical protein
MPYSAYVFCRPGGAPILGFPYGHVGFGFQIDDAGMVRAGAVEVKDGSTSHVNNAMDFWTQDTPDPETLMGTANPYGRETRYDMCKILAVAAPNVAAAEAQVTRIAGIDYNLLEQNCRTDVVDILQAYGVTGLPGGSRPSGFFGGISATIVPLVKPWPGIALDFSIYSQTDQFGQRDDPDANDQGYVADPQADKNPYFEDGPTPVLGSFLVRSGFVELFPEEYYSGEPVKLPLGKVFNFRNVPWPDTTVRSWYASEADFDASSLAANAGQIVSRFATDSQRATHARSLGLPPHFTLPLQRSLS